MTVHLPKLNKGEQFSDLDLLTMLKTKSNKPHPPTGNPLIQEINPEPKDIDQVLQEEEEEEGEQSMDSQLLNGNGGEEEDPFNWEIPQELQKVT